MNKIYSYILGFGTYAAFLGASASAQNANFVVIGPTGAAAWDATPGTWVTLGGSYSAAAGSAGTTASRNLGVMGSGAAAAYNDAGGAWSTLGSGGAQLVGDNNGTFGVRDTGTVAAWNPATGTWISQPLANIANLQGSAGNLGASLNGAAGSVAAWSQTSGAWSNRSVAATYGTSLTASEGNFLAQGNIDVFYSWDKSTLQWHRIDEGGVTARIGSAGNLALQGSANTWVWNHVLNTYAQGYALGGNPANTVGTDGNFGFLITNTVNNYFANAYDKNANLWSYQAQGNSVRWGNIAGSGGNIAVVAQNSGNGFAVFQGSTGAWTMYNVNGGTNLLVGSGGNFAFTKGPAGANQLMVWKPGISPTAETGGFPNTTRIDGSDGNFVGFANNNALIFWDSAANVFRITTGGLIDMVGSRGNFAAWRANGSVVAIKSGASGWASSGITATAVPVASEGNFGAIGVNSATRYTKSVGANGTFHDLSITGATEIKGAGGNFAVRGSTQVAAIRTNSTSWTTLSLAADRIEGSGFNFAALSSAASTVTAWDNAEDTWYSLGGFANNGLSLVGSAGNFAALGTSSVAAFDQADNAWFTLNGAFTGLLGGGGSFVAYGSSGAAVWEPDDNNWNFLAGDYSFLAAASIPEPSTVGLAGLGLVTLLFRRRAQRT